jgi:hypothetical protein
MGATDTRRGLGVWGEDMGRPDGLIQNTDFTARREIAGPGGLLVTCASID